MVTIELSSMRRSSDIVDVESSAVVVEAREDFAGPRTRQECQVGRCMTDLRVDLSASGYLGIAVGPRTRMHVRLSMCGLRVGAAKKIVNWIRHQDADHAYLAKRLRQRIRRCASIACAV